MTYKIGLISDIHGYAPELTRAIDILMREQVDKILCCGDVVEHGPDADEVVECLHRSLIACVQGNHDENAIKHAATQPAHSSLSDSSLALLSQYPMTRSYEICGQRLLVAHVTPQSNKTYVFADKIPRRLKRCLRHSPTDYVLLGHTHRPMDTQLLDIRLLNPGSVRAQKTRDSHSCATLSLPDGEFKVFDLKTGRTW